MKITSLATAAFAVLVSTSIYAAPLPTYSEVRAAYRPSETLILDRGGQVLQRQRTDNTVRRGPWTLLADISPALRLAMVLSEDKRFYQHSGVDWASVSAAAWGNLFNQRTRGASTISMQLVGMIDHENQPLAGQRSIFDKVEQAVSGQVLDRRWRKDQVLEAYLNLVPFRGEIQGIDALSRTLFDKAPHGLDERESAIAAALVRAPNAAPRLVSQRACGVWRDMRQALRAAAPISANASKAAKATIDTSNNAEDCTAVTLLTEAALLRRAYPASEGIAPHASQQTLRKWKQVHAATQPPRSITTTLDIGAQRIAAEALSRHLRELRDRNVNDGAVVVLDNRTGDVLAYIGSSGELSQAREVDAASSPRQPGSTLKPFLYAQALAEQRITAASLLDDSPTHIATQGGLYIPQNYDRHFKGWVSARTALASSLNVPAVRTLAMVSPDAFARQLQALGLGLPQPGDYYGFSLALGSAEVTLLDLTNAYRTLANGGRLSAVRFLPDSAAAAVPTPATSSAPVIDPRAVFIVSDILSDPNARARTFGTRSVLATPFWSAVKTGTSKDMRDNWVVGWSQDYTVGVWVGNAEGQAMWDVSGTSGAAPVWADVMRYLHVNRPSHAPTPPAGLVRQHVRFTADTSGKDNKGSKARSDFPLEAERDEWFISGTQQAVFSRPAPQDQSETSAAIPRILAPVSGTIVALDPDIPPDHQRLDFRARGSDVRWRLDGKPLGKGEHLSWLPMPGRHKVELIAANGQLLDTITLEVRGAGLASASTRTNHQIDTQRRQQHAQPPGRRDALTQ